MYGNGLIQKYATDESGNVDEGKASLIEASLGQYAKTVDEANGAMNLFDETDNNTPFLEGVYAKAKGQYEGSYNDFFSDFNKEFIKDTSAVGEAPGTRTAINYKAVATAYLESLGYTGVEVDESGKLISAINSSGEVVDANSEGVPELD
jgi:hypothetical protein